MSYKPVAVLSALALTSVVPALDAQPVRRSMVFLPTVPPPNGERLRVTLVRPNEMQEPTASVDTSALVQQVIRPSQIPYLARQLPRGFTLDEGRKLPITSQRLLVVGQNRSRPPAPKTLALFPVRFSGIPLAKGSDVLSVFAPDGRVLLVRRRGIPVAVDGTSPRVDGRTAGLTALGDFAQQAGRRDARAGDADLQVWVDDQQQGRLAWRIVVASASLTAPAAIEYHISALDGRVLSRANAIHTSFTGKVTADTWAASPFEATSSADMPFLSVDGTGQGTTTTDAQGGFGFGGSGVSSTFTASLNGRFGVVSNQAGATSTAASVGTAGVSTKVHFTASTDQQIAQTSAYRWINAARQFAIGIINPEDSRLARLPINVNIAQNCNAFWFSDSKRPTVNFFQAGNGCPNTAYSDVVLHEFGHGVDQMNGGIVDGGYSEGFGDALAILLTRQSCVGRNFFGFGSCLRNAATAVSWPLPAGTTSVHEIGRPYGGFVWRLTQELGKTMGQADAFLVAKQLILGAAAANPSSVPDAVQLSFIVDDDDGNLGTCSTHFAQLAAAADAFSIPRPANCRRQILRAVYAVGDNGSTAPNGVGGYDLLSGADRVVPFDYDGDGKQDLFLYRPGRGAAWVARSVGDGSFVPAYAQGDPGTGLAGFDLKSPSDRVLALDYNGDGKQDLLLYRPGKGAAYVARSNGDGSFTPVYAQGDPGTGLAGFDLKSPNDRVLVLDYDGDKKQDLLLYRPGKGAVWIARSNGDGKFTAVYAQGDPGAGLAGFDLKSPADQALVLDYNGDGRQDLFFYRPGKGAAWVARSNGDGSFTAVHAQGDPGNGLAGFDLKSPADRVLVFDYNGDKKDDLFLYRPGRGATWIARSNGNGGFTAVHAQGDNGAGLAGYDFRSPADRAVAFDYNGDGRQDLFLYRAGQGAAWVVRSKSDGTFDAPFSVGDDGKSNPNGVAGYDLLSPADVVIPFDYNGDKKIDLFLSRPGRGAAWVAQSLGD